MQSKREGGTLRLLMTMGLSLITVSAIAVDRRINLHQKAICGDPNSDGYTTRIDPFNGDSDDGQPGVILKTSYTDGNSHWFMVYENSVDTKPLKALKVAANAEVFVDIPGSCKNFEGRIIRGDDVNFDGKHHNLGTWAEINWVNYPDAYGDISVIEGNDGPVTYTPDDGQSSAVGFDNDIISGAPDDCVSTKDSGAKALKPTDKNGQDEKTRGYTQEKLNGKKVYIVQDDPASIHSKNGRVTIAFYQGNH